MLNIDPEEWVRVIAKAVWQIADREYQERSWFGLSATEVGSADEAFNRLFSDLDFEDFLESPHVQLTNQQHQLGAALRDRMNEYASRTPTNLSDPEVFNDPAWDEIRQAARRFFDSLQVGPETPAAVR